MKKKVLYFVKRFKIVLILAVMIAAALFIFLKFRKNKPDEMSLQKSLQTTTLKKRNLSSSVSVTGTIASADKREVTTTLKDMEIKEISVAVGDYVNAGDTVVIFDSSDLEDELETTQNDYELDSLKQNQSLEQAKDSVSDAEDTYQKGVKEQESLVADALSEYNSAQSKEADALSSYQKAQNATEKAKEAYESLKENKSRRSRRKPLIIRQKMIMTQ